MYLHVNYFWRRPHFDILIDSIGPEFLDEHGNLWVGRTRREIFVLTRQSLLESHPAFGYLNFNSVLFSSSTTLLNLFIVLSSTVESLKDM